MAEDSLISNISGLGSNERKFIERINQIIYNGREDPVTFNIDGETITFYVNADFGKTTGFADIKMGTVRSSTGIQTPFILTVTSYSEIQQFMNEIERLAKVKIKDAAASAFSGGLSDMGVDDAMKYMKNLYDTEGQYAKAVFMSIAETFKNGLGKAVGELVLGTDQGESAFKRIFDLETHWDNLKNFGLSYQNRELLVKAFLQETEIMSADDINGINDIFTEVKDTSDFIEYLRKAKDDPNRSEPISTALLFPQQIPDP